jgi:putative hemolysin
VVEEQGEIKEEEREMIHNVFELDDTSTSEIMTPRADMFVVDADAPLDFKAIADSGFTRIPVIEGDIDHVVGILNIKDIFMHQATSETPVNVRAIMRPPTLFRKTRNWTVCSTSSKPEKTTWPSSSTSMAVSQG